MPSFDLSKPEVRSGRAWRLIVLVGVGALILVARLFELQVQGVEDSRETAVDNRVRRERVAAPRGLIVDRNGAVLGDSRPSFTVLVEPRRALDRANRDAFEETMEVLMQLRDASREELLAWLEKSSGGPKRVVRHDVGFAEISRIAEAEGDLQGIHREVAHVRSYPQGSLAAHLLGHVGEISEDDIREQRDAGYRQGDFWGRTGLERRYEKELRGRPGKRFFEVDAYGRVLGPFTAWPPEPPRPGKTLHLHLDLDLQVVAESLLAGQRGSVVVLDARTGGVRVMASAPGFDPNLFATGIGSADWDRLNTDENKPLLDRSVQATYAPGSTFKMISLVMTLEDRLMPYRSHQPTPCMGGYAFGNRWFGCWEELGHGSLDLEQALVQSCDTYFYQVAERVNVNQLARHARSAGLGRITGIDLPQELRGNVPDSTWLNTRYGEKKWTQGALLNLVIGQGEFLVTPLQMAVYAATIGNGGTILAPRLVDFVEGEDGRVAHPPIATGEWSMSDRTRSRLREAMRLVVADSLGTGRSCRIEGLTIAGKTGTTENPHGAPHSWFVGYAPADDPEIAFSIVVEGGGHGSDTAVPMARTILRVWAGAERGTT